MCIQIEVKEILQEYMIEVKEILQEYMIEPHL